MNKKILIQKFFEDVFTFYLEKEISYFSKKMIHINRTPFFINGKSESWVSMTFLTYYPLPFPCPLPGVPAPPGVGLGLFGGQLTPSFPVPG
jgi:hypothetical protein